MRNSKSFRFAEMHRFERDLDWFRDELVTPRVKMALRLQAILLHGLVIVYQQRVFYLLGTVLLNSTQVWHAFDDCVDSGCGRNC